MSETKDHTVKVEFASTAADKPNVMDTPLTCSLHPLVIMNVSENWKKSNTQNSKTLRVIGALIGKQKDRNIEIMNSFELVFSVIDEDVIIDRDYYNMKEERFKQVFNDMDFIGWYIAGDSTNSMDKKIHKQICEINKSSIMLKLDPFHKNIGHLPVTLYESVNDLVNGETTMQFVPLTYTLANASFKGKTGDREYDGRRTIQELRDYERSMLPLTPPSTISKFDV